METKITPNVYTARTGNFDTPGETEALATAREAWTACARLLAGTDRVRIGRRTSRGALEYRTRDERPLTSVLPVAPAAIRVYGPDGCCAALHIDLDSARGGTDAVDADARRLTAWLEARGARVVADRSPNGGRHIYVPAAGRVPFDTAQEIVEALAGAYPTLDASPHRSLKTGCIRPPGAAHKSGGHQELTMPLGAAYDVLRRPNPPSVLERIRTDLSAEIAAWRTTRLAQDVEPSTDTHAGPLSGRVRAIAETGAYDHARYDSPSEARHAVITAAAGAGWDLAHVAVRLADGRWPGLAGLYARYSPTARHGALARDWHAAQRFLTVAHAERMATSGKDHARKSHTSPSKSHGGTPAGGETPDDHDFIRTWRTALRVTEGHRFPGRGGHLTRFVLRAMGEAAHKTGSRYVAFGTRSLAVAAGAEYSSVAAVLRDLAAQQDGWVDLIEAAHGERADLYALTIPDDVEQVGRGLRWDRGKAHALRPAFRELGHVAAFVFEALEAGRATSVTTLVPATGLSRTAVTQAVEVLVGHSLVERTVAGLVARPERLTAVAEMVGALDAVRVQLRTYARQRQDWHAFLGRHDADVEAPEMGDDEAWWWPPDDVDPSWTLVGAVAA